MIRLVLIDSDGVRSEREFERTEITIGRSPDNDLVLHAAEIARRHARITEEDGKVVVQDLQSSGGIFVNEMRVARHVLRPEDKIRMGRWTIQAVARPDPIAFGSYRLVERLSVGLVETWRGERIKAPTGEVKVERISLSQCPSAQLSAFQDQLKRALTLHHRNVAQLVECLTADEHLHLIQWRHPGKPLGEVLERAAHLGEPVPQSVAAQIAAHLCEGLQHAHDKGIIHKRLGLEGIEVGWDGVTRIFDFLTMQEGLADDEGDRPMLAIHGQHSLSPEAVLGKEADARADVFSVGAILFRCVAGKPPFAGEAPFDVLRNILEGEALPLRMERPDVRPELAHYVKVAMAKDREQRWPRAQVFGAALEAFIDSAGGGGPAAVAQWMRGLFPDEAPADPAVAEPKPALPARTRADSRDELPLELQRWASELKVFPPDLAKTLGPWVQRIELVVGPPRQAPGRGDGEPDGIGGLSRRGSYERLLLSEWLMANEMPEEFLRRAAMDEHLFLELARRKPQGARRAVVLFDAGPSQLGTPRLAHLAALVVLTARAREAGDALVFGLLGDREHQQWDEITRASVGALLAGRTATEADEKDIELWREAVAPAKEEDLWLVGGARLEKLARGAMARLELSDVIEPDVRKLRAAVHRPGAHPQSVMLELPEASLCTRLLRDPFGVPKEAGVHRGTAKVDPGFGLLVPQRNRRVLALNEAGEVLALSIPSSPKVPPGHTRWFQPPKGENVQAAGVSGKRLLVLTRRGEEGFTLWGIGPSNRAGRPCAELQWEGPTGRIRPGVGLGPVLRMGAAQFLAVADATLVKISLFGKMTISLTAEPVVALGTALGQFTWAVDALFDGTVRIVGHEKVARTVTGDGSKKVFIAGGGSRESVAINDRQGEWLLVRGGTALEARLPAPPGTVVGIANVRSRPEPGLLAIEPSRHHLVVHGDGWDLTLPAATGSIVKACSSEDGDLAVWLSETGEVGVFSFPYGRMLLRYQPQVLEQARTARPASA